MLISVSREIFYESGGRIYKRMGNNSEVLVRQTIEQFIKIVKKWLDNIRYDDPIDGTSEHDYHHYFDTLVGGTRVFVHSRSSLVYDGIFQFNSIVDRNYCYVDFDTRSRAIRWEKRLVVPMDLEDMSNRRVTRQMTRSQRVTARGLLSDRNQDNEGRLNMDIDIIDDNTSFSTLFDLLGDGTENMPHYDEVWLTGKGFVVNTVGNEKCSICLGYVDVGTQIYNLQCGDKLIHPLHAECAKLLINSKATTCPSCRFAW